MRRKISGAVIGCLFLMCLSVAVWGAGYLLLLFVGWLFSSMHFLAALAVLGAVSSGAFGAVWGWRRHPLGEAVRRG